MYQWEGIKKEKRLFFLKDKHGKLLANNFATLALKALQGALICSEKKSIYVDESLVFTITNAPTSE